MSKSGGGDPLPFRAEALQKSIRKAVRKELTGDVPVVVERVIAQLQAFDPSQPVPSRCIGEAVLDELRRLDAVSHVRFGMVFFGRLDVAPRLHPAGMFDAADFLTWLYSEYPDLAEDVPPPMRPRGYRSIPAVVSRGWQPRQVLKQPRFSSDGGTGLQAFAFDKFARSIALAAKGRRRTESELERYADWVAVRSLLPLRGQPVVTTWQLAAEVLRCFREDDDLAYLRFVSIAKHFESVVDFKNEALGLLRHPSLQSEPAR